MGLLRHRPRRPTQNDPLRLRHSNLHVHGVHDVLLVELQPIRRHVPELGRIERPAHAHVRLNVLHEPLLDVGPELHLLDRRLRVELPQNTILLRHAERTPTGLGNGSDELDGERLGDVERLDEDVLTGLHGTGVTNDRFRRACDSGDRPRRAVPRSGSLSRGSRNPSRDETTHPSSDAPRVGLTTC